MPVEVRDAYDEWSSSYDSVENPTRDLDSIATKETLAALCFRRVLELGCGTGKNTVLLAQTGAHVHAVDFSPGMLAIARAKIKSSHVLFTVADVNRAWPQADASVDLVCCNLILEHIASIGFVFGEARRCLVPGGRFFISELHPAKQYQGKKANFQVNGTRTEIPAHVHHISDFLDAAGQNGLSLLRMNEWWHQPDRDQAPLLVSFLFEK